MVKTNAMPEQNGRRFGIIFNKLAECGNRFVDMKFVRNFYAVIKMLTRKFEKVEVRAAPKQKGRQLFNSRRPRQYSHLGF
jgi:hypothetical protein